MFIIINVQCSGLTDVRHRYYDVATLFELFNTVPPHTCAPVT